MNILNIHGVEFNIKNVLKDKNSFFHSLNFLFKTKNSKWSDFKNNIENDPEYLKKKKTGQLNNKLNDEYYHQLIAARICYPNRRIEVYKINNNNDVQEIIPYDECKYSHNKFKLLIYIGDNNRGYFRPWLRVKQIKNDDQIPDAIDSTKTLSINNEETDKQSEDVNSPQCKSSSHNSSDGNFAN